MSRADVCLYPQGVSPNDVLLRAECPAQAPFDLVTVIGAEPVRRSPAAQVLGGAALVLAPILALSAATGDGTLARRKLAEGAYGYVSEAVAPAATFDLPPPVQAQIGSRPRRVEQAWALVLDPIRQAPPPVLAEHAHRSRPESRSAPLLPDAIVLAPPPVLAEHAHRSRPESRSAPLLPDAIVLAPPPVLAEHAHRSRPESRSAPLLPDVARAAPPPVLAEQARATRSGDAARSTPLLPDAARLAPAPVTAEIGRRREHPDPLPSEAPFLAPSPAPDPAFRGSVWKKRRQWIDIPETARTGRVVLTIEELLEPEPLPPPPPDHPLFAEVVQGASAIGIHETPELAALREKLDALRAKLAAEEARSRGLVLAESAASRSARRWRFAAVGLAVVLVLTRGRR